MSDAIKARAALEKGAANQSQKSLAIMGVLLTAPTRMLSKNDKPYLSFGLQDLKTSIVYKAMIFNNLDALGWLTTGSRVSSRGHVKDDVYFLQYIAPGDAKAIPRVSPQLAKKSGDALRKWYDQQGMAPINERDEETGEIVRVWVKKNSLIEISPGIWKRKIDHIGECLGFNELTSRLRSKMKDLSAKNIRVERGSFPGFNRYQANEMSAFINELLEEVNF